MRKRPDWLTERVIARLIGAERNSVCKRRHVGCVLLNADGNSIAVGYNSKQVDYSECTNVPRDCGCIHAEISAVVSLMHTNPHTSISIPTYAVITCAPCLPCYQTLRYLGVQQFWYIEDSEPGVRAAALAEKNNIGFYKFELP